MTDPTTIALAREVLATERTRYHGQPERTDETLARALLEAQEEKERLREQTTGDATIEPSPHTLTVRISIAEIALMHAYNAEHAIHLACKNAERGMLDAWKQRRALTAPANPTNADGR